MKKNRNLKKLMGVCLAIAMLLAFIPGVSAEIRAASSTIETFEDAAFATEGVEGTTLFTGTSTSQSFNIGSNLALAIQGEGNKVEILTDPITSSKAMKITHTGSGTIQIYNYYGGNTNQSTKLSNKIIKTGCKVRLVSQKNTAITRFNRIDNAGVTISGGVIWNKKFAGMTTAVQEINGAQTLSSDSYVSTSVTYNYATNKAVRQSEAATSEGTGSGTQFNRTWYRFEAAGTGTSYTSNQWKGTDANTTEIWLDDFYFETYEYEPQISVAGQAGAYKNGASYTSTSLTGIPLNAPIEVRFNGECSDDAISAENYTLKDSGNNDVVFTVERFTDNIITVYPKYQIGGETYTFTAKAGIASVNAAIDTRTARSVTYTTVTNGLSFRGYVESENFEDVAEITYTATTPSSNFLDGKIDIRQNVNNESIGVVTDAVTGNKALRIYINNQNSSGRYLWVLPEAYTSGRFVTTFDLRIANLDAQNGYLMSFGSSFATDGRSGGWINSVKSRNYWAFTNNNTIDQWSSKSNWDSSVYFPVMMSIDFASTTFSGQVYRKYGTASQSLITKSNSFASASNCDNLKYIQLAELKKTSGADATEIYIDNLRVAQYDYDDFVLTNVVYSGNTITGDLTNNTSESKSCIAIGAQFDSNGRFTYADKVGVTVGSGETESITVEFITSAPINELYIWDGLTNINALTKKRSFR